MKSACAVILASGLLFSGACLAETSCSAVGRTQLALPRIEVTKTFGSPTSQGSVRLQGYVEGVCISEAGLFKGGEEVESIAITTDPVFRRFSFDLTVGSGKKREIRAYNTQGGRATYPLADTNVKQDPLGLGVDRFDEDEEQEEEGEEGGTEFFGD